MDAGNGVLAVERLVALKAHELERRSIDLPGIRIVIHDEKASRGHDHHPLDPATGHSV
jgi:hypothetical protein